MGSELACGAGAAQGCGGGAGAARRLLGGKGVEPLVEIARPGLPRGQVRLDAEQHAPAPGVVGGMRPCGGARRVWWGEEGVVG